MIPLIALAACQDDGGDGDSPDLATNDACGASGWHSLIGEHLDILAVTIFRAPMRVIGPNDAVTMDYNPQRLNVIYGDDDIITRVECG
ncbi:I78 family peptidase inhibitor [Rhodophyticola sp. CCM32]|uniref:I78 family peptidase inhibitor n=1 Tax=Rhodophyticola sp. CCM32 TaxID=2916397 RepID=UPI00143D0C95|nr:I78 family peptidase inhibitor [Rhodophyticola sp. CCM32]